MYPSFLWDVISCDTSAHFAAQKIEIVHIKFVHENCIDTIYVYSYCASHVDIDTAFIVLSEINVLADPGPTRVVKNANGDYISYTEAMGANHSGMFTRSKNP